MYKTALEKGDRHVAEYALKVVPQDLMSAMLPHATPERTQQLHAIVAGLSQSSKAVAAPMEPSPQEPVASL